MKKTAKMRAIEDALNLPIHEVITRFYYCDGSFSLDKAARLITRATQIKVTEITLWNWCRRLGIATRQPGHRIR